MSVYANYVECTNPGTYKVTALTNKIKVYLVGGGGAGGGGGGSQHNNRRRSDRAGGGGGSGSSGEIQFWINEQPNIKNKSIEITVGYAGKAGSPGTNGDPNANNGNSGGNGSASSVTIDGETCTANGGKGGGGGEGAWRDGGRGADGRRDYSLGGVGGASTGSHCTAGTDGDIGKPGKHIRDVRTGSTGGRESHPLSNTIGYTAEGGSRNMSINHTGIYPNNRPGMGGSGGTGAYAPTNAQFGRDGNKGYARIYFIDDA